MTRGESLSLRGGVLVQHQRYGARMEVAQLGADGVWLATPGYPDGPRCPLTAPEEWAIVEREGVADATP